MKPHESILSTVGRLSVRSTENHNYSWFPKSRTHNAQHNRFQSSRISYFPIHFAVRIQLSSSLVHMDWPPLKMGFTQQKKTSKQYNIYAFCFPAVRPKINASISPWSICNGLGRLPYHWINWWWDEHSAVESCGEEAYVDNAAHKSLISLLRLKPFSFQCFAYILACGNCSKSKWYRKIRPKLIDRIGIEFVRSFLSHSVLFTIAVRTHLAEPIANIFIFYAKRIDLVWFQATELVDSTILRQLGSSFDGVGSELTYLAAQNRFSMWKFTIIRLIKWSRGRCHSHDTPTRKANAWFVIWMSRAPSAVSVMATLQFYMNNR